MDRGRNSTAAPTLRMRYDSLDALVRASNAWRLGYYATTETEAERAVIGILRCAARAGATVGELTGATLKPRDWVTVQIGRRG